MSTSNCIWLALKKSTSLLLAHVILFLLFVTSPSYAAVHGNSNPGGNNYIPTNQVSTVLFVDANVQDSQELLSGVTAGTDVIRLQGDSDGVQQIVTALKSYRNLDSIQIISHGAPGKLALGSISLTDANLDRYQSALQA